MRRRYIYVLLFAVPAFLLAAVGAAIAAGMVAGVLWLFVFGDSPWPGWTGPAIVTAAVATGLALWLAQMTVAFIVGQQQEARPTLDRRHVVLALGATVAIAALIAIRTIGLGRGAVTDPERCADYCVSKGFSASGTPPRTSGERTCTCYDAQGRPAITTTIEGGQGRSGRSGR